MKEFLRTNDQVLISWLRVLLGGENIEMIVLDTHTSIVEGSAGAIPRRLMVIDEDHARAVRLYAEYQEEFERGTPE